MKISKDRILTTHVGSLPRSEKVFNLVFAKEDGKNLDKKEYDEVIADAVKTVVKKQEDVGIDVVSDGEQSKISYATYIKDRLNGFEGDSPRRTPKDLEERLEAKNLLGIYSSLTNSTLQNSISIFAGKNFSEFKDKLSDELVNKIDPISKEIKKLLGDQQYLDKILIDGVKKANEIASKKIERMKEIVGFL